jgi:hypothetical protein
MSSIAFDTLKFTQKLRESGFEQAQAEAVATAFKEATSEELVTKDYLEARLEKQTADIYRAILFQTFAIGGLVFAAIKLAN